jgi:hypothetical protein
MSAEQKINYAEVAKNFDRSLNHQKSQQPQTETIRESTMDGCSITLPLITVLQRTGCSVAPHEASMALLDLVIEGEHARRIVMSSPSN